MGIERVYIFDTTLRDGEQSPGASMTTGQKARIARVLEGLGVDIIEAGFPIASKRDFDSVSAVARGVTNVIVCALARANEEDIVRASEALQEAHRKRIHTFIATSPVHMEHKLRMKPEDVLRRVSASVEFARNITGDVEWSAEDATRSDIDFLCRCVESAINAGAGTINLPDTVGYTTPEEYAHLFRTIRERVPNSHKAVFSAHCHNDLGLAVANSLAAIDAGVRQVECTINGIGERAGNAAMEELVMALTVRKDVKPYFTRIATKQFLNASRMVSAVTGFVVQPNKAIVGDNAFAHASGIHQHGILKRRETYEIMDPADVGRTESQLVLQRHSGRAAVSAVLKEGGYTLDNESFEKVYQRFEEIASEKKNVLADELLAFMEDYEAVPSGPYELVACDIHLEAHKNVRNARVILKLRHNGRDLMPRVMRSTDGEVDACLRAVQRAFSVEAQLAHFHVQALGEEADAVAKVWITLEHGGIVGRATATDTSTTVAAVKAYVNALNELSRAQTEGAEDTIPRPGRLTP